MIFFFSLRFKGPVSETVEFSADKCVICLKEFNSSSPEVNVFSKGLSKLINLSKERKMDALHSYLTETCNSNGKVLVHHDCRRKFTDARKESSREMPPKKLRSSQDISGFDWKFHCFLCCGKIDNNNIARNPIAKVQTLPIRDSLIKRAEERNDDWGNQVLGKLLTCNDLVAEEAIYHLVCMNKFRLERLNPGKKGRPVNSTMMDAYGKVCYWLENETDCELYTLKDVHEKMRSLSDDGTAYTIKTLKKKLQDKYKEHIYFTQLPGHEDVIGFRNMTDRILHEMKTKDHQTKEDIIIAAAKLVKEDIRELDKNTDFYPTVDDIKDEENANPWVPESLKIFLNSLITSELKKKTLGQCITQASRPRSIICPLMFGLGVELEKTFGSKWLVNHLSRMGFCISNDEVLRYKESAIETSDGNRNENKPEFVQWVADNVDHNVITLTGKDTFHGMGIISITQPEQKLQQQQVLRLKHRKKVSDVIKDKGIELHSFHGSSKMGLSTLTIHPLHQLTIEPTTSKEVDYNIFWHINWFSSSPEKPRPNWNGFMQSATSKAPVEDKSMVTFLPIIDLNPSDDSCIYSTLLFIMDQAKSLGILVPSVTFDQPLWLKATGIVEHEKLDIVCRLGGFHTLSSFAGSLGHLMKGSGIEELFSQVYAEHTVTHMISGKAISRALRAHFLAESALVTLLIEEIIDESDVFALDGQDSNEIEKKMSSDEFIKFREKIEEKLSALTAKSRTAKLWILYLKYISTIKKFIVAERTSNWPLHLEATKEMLTLFAATGHINYAKSARLYLQQMMVLHERYPWLHQKFQQGFHAVRRSERYWAGLWSDLTIEQTLMRSIKTRGGLTRGRGMNEDVRHLWVLSLSDSAIIHQAMTDVFGLTVKSSEQHVEMGMTRCSRDYADCKVFLEWLKKRNPFSYEDQHLHSLSLGLVSDGQDGINCDRAEEIGQMIQEKMDNTPILECKIKRKDQIQPIIALQNRIKIDKASVDVNPNMLFTRLIAIAQREKEDSKEFFAYELTQEPMSLFKKGLMRKPDKPSLRKAIMKDDDALVRDQLPSYSVFVVDGGGLLHRVRWNRNATFDELSQMYTRYVRKYYKSCIIVFDGYEHLSTKSSEHLRRTGGGKQCPNVDVIGCNKVPFPQDRFLTNTENKTQFIKFLGIRLEQDGQTVKICTGDADTTIVSTALHEAESNVNTVVTVADDTDIAMLLIYHWQDRYGDVIFFQEKVNRGWNMKYVCNQWDSIREHILFVHAFSGCDTTSAPFGKGKSSFLSLISKNETLQQISYTMSNVWAEQDEVGAAAIKAFQIIYGGKNNESLCNLR